jgi:hypothetical protein
MAVTCDRCNAEAGFHEDNDPRIQEFVTSYGFGGMLCFDCRKDWNRYSANHDMFTKYAELGFTFRCWQARWRKKPGTDKDMESGIEILRKLHAMDKRLLKLTDEWILKGTKERRQPERDDSEDDGDGYET